MPEHFMEYALRLAERSVGLASPNPAVGCVLVKDERIVGEGAHEYDKHDHAEIVALRQAGEAARGATAYVTLEPCCHHGRTGPCADALLAAGVAEVVVATTDPNPLVRGEGIERLRGAGVRVRLGVMEEEARQLNDGFAKLITDGRPFVTMKVASSLDGRVGPGWLTSEAAGEESHRMRHESDAILVGVGTILTDDPLLTDRSGLPRRRPLLRVVLDSRLRTPAGSRLVSTAANDVVVFYRQAESATVAALEARGVRLLPMKSFPDVLAQLGKMQMSSVIVEGGSRVWTSAMEQDLVDRLVMFYAPRFLGSKGMPMLGEWQQRIETYSLRQLGPDFALEARFRDYWNACLPA